MRVTVCELPDERVRRDAAWQQLARYLEDHPTDVLALPEMPFVDDWTVFTSPDVDPVVWKRALADHDAMISRLVELRVDVVLASRPVEIGGRRLNQGFAWTRDGGYQGGRSKVYLPDEPDGREARPLAAPASLRAGRLPDVHGDGLHRSLSWRIGRSGAHLLAAPRATGGHRRWMAAASLMAIVSGCFVASANRRSYDRDDFCGQSWIISPEGELAEMTAGRPFETVEIDLRRADSAKATYPKNLAL